MTPQRDHPPHHDRPASARPDPSPYSSKMESLIDQLVARSGAYTGTGDGQESGPFTATIELQPLVGSLGASIAYRAVDPVGEQLHEEQTMLAYDMLSGQLTLWVLCDELSGVGQLREVSTGVFNNGAGPDGFELQIEIGLAAEELTYTWLWSRPGAPLAEQSRAVVRRGD